jgi:hypothetical protein
VDGVKEITRIMTRLRGAASLPDTLAVAFDAFEVIRQLARDCENRVPALFATFMTAADAAVDGRDSIAIAPAFPHPRGAEPAVTATGPNSPVEEITGDLARLGAVLRERLWRGATIAATPGDQTACTDGAQAAGRICHLMVRGDDDARPR